MKEFILGFYTFSKEGFLGITYGEYFLVFLILVISLLVNGFMRSILVKVMRHVVPKKKENDKIIEALEKPLKLVPLVCGSFMILYFLNLHGKPLSIASDILKSILIGVTFWCTIRVLIVSDSLVGKIQPDVQVSVREWLDTSIVVLLGIFGVGIILDIWNIPILPIIGSLGVLGIGIGMAARDLFTNLISGILIMTEKRFIPGEWVEVEGVVNGTVEKINFRSTLIRLFDSSPAYVPNGLLSDRALTNYSRMHHRRIYWMIGLEYTTSPEALVKIRQDTEKWILDNPRVCSPQEQTLFVRIDSFGTNSIDLMIYCFTKTKVWGEWLQIKEEFALALINIVQKAGAGFAFPSRTLYWGKDSGQPEVFNPLNPLAPSELENKQHTKLG